MDPLKIVSTLYWPKKIGVAGVQKISCWGEKWAWKDDSAVHGLQLLSQKIAVEG
jgi:hypothetical protein